MIPGKKAVFPRSNLLYRATAYRTSFLARTGRKRGNVKVMTLSFCPQL